MIKKILVFSVFVLCSSFIKAQTNNDEGVFVDSLIYQINNSDENIHRKIADVLDGLEKYPNNIQLLRTHAQLLISYPNYKEARRVLENALLVEKNNIYVLSDLARLLYDDDKYTECIQICERGIIINPNVQDFYYHKGHSLKQIGKHYEALTAYNLGVLNDNMIYIWEEVPARLWGGIGNVYYYIGENEKAESAFEKAIQSNPNEFYALLKLAIINNDNKDWQKSNYYVNRAMPLLKKNNKYDLISEAYIVRAKNNEHFDKTKAEIDKQNAILYADSTINDKNTVYGYYVRGKARLEIGHYSDAILDLTEAIKDRPKDQRFLLSRGSAYYYYGQSFQNNGELDVALKFYTLGKEDFDKALKDSPDLAKGEDNISLLNKNFDYLKRLEKEGKLIQTKEDKSGLTTAKYYGIFIGIGKYIDKNTWHHLPNAVNDAKAISEVLYDKYNFTEIDTLFDSKATYKDILLAFKRAENFSKENHNTNVLIYFAGHGWRNELLKEKGGQGFWIPVDAEGTKIGTLLSSSLLEESFNLINLYATHTLVISDACFSGRLMRGSIAVSNENLKKGDDDYYFRSYNRRKSCQLMTSGDDETVSDGITGHSEFCSSLLYEFKTRKNLFDASDLFNSVKGSVSKDTRQTPLLAEFFDGIGQFIFQSDN